MLLSLGYLDLDLLPLRLGSFPPLSAELNSLATRLGMPRVLFPLAAALMALRWASLLGGMGTF